MGVIVGVLLGMGVSVGVGTWVSVGTGVSVGMGVSVAETLVLVGSGDAGRAPVPSVCASDCAGAGDFSAVDEQAVRENRMTNIITRFLFINCFLFIGFLIFLVIFRHNGQPLMMRV